MSPKMAPSDGWVRWLKDTRLADIPTVGGKMASLGELYVALSGQGVRVPNAFSMTADVYRDTLTEAGVWAQLHGLLDNLDKRDIEALRRSGAQARQIVYQATDTARLRNTIARCYSELEREYGADVTVVVRSSATAEDLPNASF